MIQDPETLFLHVIRNQEVVPILREQEELGDERSLEGSDDVQWLREH
jgi:hypothetical protein